MKVLSLAVPALLAASVSARASFFSTSDVSANDEEYNVPGDNPLQHCDNPADDFLEIKTIDLDPNPPQAGKKLTVTATGVLTKDIEEGANMHLEVKYGLIKLINQNTDLCTQVKNVDLECPLKKGPLKIVKEVELPAQIPPGTYSVLANLTTKGSDEITCLRASVAFHTGGSSLFKQDV